MISGNIFWAPITIQRYQKLPGFAAGGNNKNWIIFPSQRKPVTNTKPSENIDSSVWRETQKLRIYFILNHISFIRGNSS